MMINPGPSDSSAVFALLTAISSPEAAKASLQEILDASEAYQKIIEEFREEFKKTSAELDAKKADADANLAEASHIKDEFDKSYIAKTKELSDLSDKLNKRQSDIDAIEADQTERVAKLTAREQQVSSREGIISSLEDVANQLNATAQAMKDDYENKLAALKAITNRN